jgi:hypothetical protein
MTIPRMTLWEWWAKTNLVKIKSYSWLNNQFLINISISAIPGYSYIWVIDMNQFTNIKLACWWKRQHWDELGGCFSNATSNKGNAKRGVSPRLKIRPCDLDLWPWKSIGFQILLRSKYVPSLVKIHWRMLILECSQGCYTVKIWPGDFDLWPWKSIGFQILLRTKYVPSLVKIHWRILILECSQGCYAVNIWSGDLDLWPMTLKINRVPDSLKD